MAMSAICAPIYLKSLGAALVGRRGKFVVTPKGGEASPDRLLTFRIHLFWAAVIIASLWASVHYGHTHAAMRTWAVIALVITLAPVSLWIWSRYTERGKAAGPRRAHVEVGPEPALAAATATAGAATANATANAAAVNATGGK
jgi:hypothetical protein